MSQITSLKVKMSAKEVEELKLQSALTALPEDGVYLLNAIDKAVEQGEVSKEDMLIAIAEKLENEGENPSVRDELVNKLRLMSYYATTRLVPVEIP
jgi:hypothetical protein